MLFDRLFGGFSLLTASALIVACSNFAETEDSSVALSATVRNDTLWVGIQDSTYKIDISTDGDWKIVNETDFASVSEESGTGNATVDLDVLYNDYDLSRYGKVTVQLPDGEQTIVVAQQGHADLDENDASQIEATNKIFAVGYSYDAIKGGYAEHNSIKKEIFDTKKLIESGVFSVGSPNINYTEKSFTGTTVAEVGYKMAQSMGIAGKQDNFQAEIENSLNLDVSANTSYEFALAYINMGIMDISSEISLDELKEDYMIPYVKKDINGLSDAYSSKNKNWKRDLVRDYGSHVVLKSTLGGRIRFAMSANTANIKGSMDMNQMSTAALKSGDASATDTASQKLVASLKQNLAAANLKIQVEGGRESKARIAAADGLPDKSAIQDWKKELLGYRENIYDDVSYHFKNCNPKPRINDNDRRNKYLQFKPENKKKEECKIVEVKQTVHEWIQEIHYDELSLVDFPQEGLEPIYELIDRSLTLEHDGVDGEARYRELKAYFEGNEIVSDFRSKFDNGAVAEIALPKYVDSDTETLIYDVFLGGQLTAKVVQEFIPELSTKSRVTVVYPVQNNKMNLKKGYFVGDATHRPAKVSWNGSNVTLTEDSQNSVGEPKKVYIRGTTVTLAPPKGATVFSGSIEGAYLKAQKATAYTPGGKGKTDYTTDTDYKYPLVKIFDKIWLRENYMSSHDRTGKALDSKQWLWTSRTPNPQKHGKVLFFKKEAAQNTSFAPKGWRVAKSSDFEQFNKIFAAKSIGSSVAGLKAGGVTGFNGDYSSRRLNNLDYGEKAISFNLADNKYATITDNASVIRVDSHSGKSNDTWRSIRLIME